jgi:response regulator RpfG family c-di-GMP phosphodiesterase
MSTKPGRSSALPTQTAATPSAAFTLLLVDDEENILLSLRRLFRSEGYRVFTADSGAAGLLVLAKEPVDLIISDMRMPEMSGAEFLAQAQTQWPDVVRILLTGHSDISSIIDAINNGQIYRYIPKPWEDTDILTCVRHGLERRQLERDKLRLEVLTQHQNEELRRSNLSLEEKVKARTQELQQTMDFLLQAHERVKKSFLTSIRVFSNLIEMREGPHSGHAKRVAELARQLAHRMGLLENESQDVVFAALLHDIGQIGWPDHLVRKPFSALTSEERAEVVKHPIKGQTILMELEQLHGAASLIRSHHERFDGKGYPDGLSGLQIPLGARILAVVNDYDALRHGTLVAHPMQARDALQYIYDTRGSRYDPMVVEKFVELMAEIELKAGVRPLEQALSAADLKPGMVLAHDLLTRDGILLLTRDHVLTAGMIAQLVNYETTEKSAMVIYVHS